MRACAERFLGGETSIARQRGVLVADLEALPGARIDYAEICDDATLTPRSDGDDARPGDLLAVAVWFGDVRLIDNLTLGEES